MGNHKMLHNVTNANHRAIIAGSMELTVEGSAENFFPTVLHETQSESEMHILNILKILIQLSYGCRMLEKVIQEVSFLIKSSSQISNVTLMNSSNLYSTLIILIALKFNILMLTFEIQQYTVMMMHLSWSAWMLSNVGQEDRNAVQEASWNQLVGNT
ncbi:hypothetical protein T11_187 [Trichinella zimbabwensis]|uniref:Uncharacterized protein n=1 Tax=Trichinella zimbabwensis TaxID=268475 RepID=A0A0V1HCF1_9BILA|nr:hypothetical protein T11_187 [Trichinella zimbabwensis]